MRDEQEIFESIKSGDENALINLYDDYRVPFIHWSYNNYSLSEEESADVFQDAMIILYHNITKGKLSELSSSLKTYLFAIGKNLALKKIGQGSRMVVNNEVVEQNPGYEDIDPFEGTERQKVIADMIEELGEPCRSILRMFYFDRFTMDAIASRLGYKNEHVAKSQKLRCFNQLKQKVKGRFKTEDL